MHWWYQSNWKTSVDLSTFAVAGNSSWFIQVVKNTKNYNRTSHRPTDVDRSCARTIIRGRVWKPREASRFWCLWQNALRWNQSNNSTSHDEHYNKRALRSSGSYRRSGRFLMIQPRVFRRRRSWLAVNLYRLQIKNVIGSCSLVTAG